MAYEIFIVYLFSDLSLKILSYLRDSTNFFLYAYSKIKLLIIFLRNKILR